MIKLANQSVPKSGINVPASDPFIQALLLLYCRESTEPVGSNKFSLDTSPKDHTKSFNESGHGQMKEREYAHMHVCMCTCERVSGCGCAYAHARVCVLYGGRIDEQKEFKTRT